MSLKIIKAGIADSIQDAGRFGYQHEGINPGGAMDLVAMQLANSLVGNPVDEAVIELCFPASVILFQKPAVLAVVGADFSATLNGRNIGVNKAFGVKEGDELKFLSATTGTFTYLAVHGGYSIPEWLGSRSTNLLAGVGGWQGRYLKKSDEIAFRKSRQVQGTRVFPWSPDITPVYPPQSLIRCMKGNEWERLDKRSKKQFSNEPFTINRQRDRMGYRLKSSPLKTADKSEIISTGVTFGTVQLLPDGQLIILMADHQTTGGYPRIAQVIMADRSKLVQHKPGDEITFSICNLEEAEQEWIHQNRLLSQIQLACLFRLNEVL